MGVYSYKARDRWGRVVEDRVEGQSVAAVAAALRRRGLLVIRVREQGVSRREVLWPFGRVGVTDLAVFTRQLSTMVGAGLPLARALHALSEQAEKRAMGDAIAAVRAGVESGVSLSGAMEERRDVFPGLYVEMVRAGEAGGVPVRRCEVNESATESSGLRRVTRSTLTARGGHQGAWTTYSPGGCLLYTFRSRSAGHRGCA